MSHSLLVLGGGPLVAPALRWARAAGLHTVVTDPDPRARARSLADEFQVVLPTDADALEALARRLTAESSLAGVLTTERGALALLPRLAEAAPAVLPARRVLELALDPQRCRALWSAQGLPVAPGPEASAQSCFEVSAFFRDGAFVPAGVSESVGPDEQRPNCTWTLLPAALSRSATRAAHALAERAARGLEFERGPLQVTLARTEAGPALVALAPGFDFMAVTRAAPLAYEKSPLQAWFAHLAGAGGPFDEMPLEARSVAGVLTLRAGSAGRFTGIEGVSRARSVLGVIDLWIDDPGREIAAPDGTVGYLWAEAKDHEELARRLAHARAALEVRVACRRVA